MSAGAPTRVTHIITSLSTGGAEITLSRLLGHMDRSRFANAVIGLGREGEMADRMRFAGVPVVALGMTPKTALLDCFRLVAELRRQRPHVVQTWMYHSDLIGGFASMALPRVPLAWNLRSGCLDTTRYKRSTVWTGRACAAVSWVLPARIIACSEASLSAHAGIGYARGRAQVIPNGFDTDEYRPDADARRSVREQLGIGRDALAIGMVARHDSTKDHPNFFRAAAIVAKTRPEARFILCGAGVTGTNQHLTRELRDTDVVSRCHLLGPRTDIPRILAALDIAVSSSATEAFSNAIGEAMACGVPCVVTDAGDTRFMVGDTGFVVPVGDARALAARILELADMGPQRRADLGASARIRIVERFSIQQVARQYEQVYRELRDVCAA